MINDNDKEKNEGDVMKNNLSKSKRKITALLFAALMVISVATFGACYGGATSVTPPKTIEDGESEIPEGKTVADYLDNPNLNLYIANSVLSKAENFKSVSKGSTVSVKVGLSITQDIYAVRYVKGDTVYKQSVSYGLVKTGDERMVHGNTYLYRSADEVNSLTDLKWSSDAPNSLTKEEFFERYGYRGNSLTGYILNDETIVSSAYNGFDENSGLYSFTYVLDNEKATARMLYEMRTNSGSTNFAVYEKAQIAVAMDENWVIHSITTDCAYNVPLFGLTPCTEKLTEEFSYVGQVTDFKQFPQYDYFSKYIDFNAVAPVEDDKNPSPAPQIPKPFEPQASDVVMSMFEGYLTGAPLNASVLANVDGYNVSADMTLKIDLEDIKNIAFSAVTENGIHLTYSNNEIYAEVNDIKMRSSVSDILAALERLGIAVPEIDFSSLDIDPTAIMAGMTLETKGDIASVHLAVTLGDITADVTINGTVNEDKTYTFTDAIVVADDIELTVIAQEKTIDELDVNDSFVNVCEVIFDYLDTIKSITEFQVAEYAEGFIEKALTIEIQPLTLNIDGTKYQTQSMTLRLYISQNKIVFVGDTFDITTTAADGAVTRKRLALSGAFVMPTSEAEGRLYLTVNDLVNADSSLKISIGAKELTDCIKKRLPELTEAVPQLKDLFNFKLDKEKILDYTALISDLTYDREHDKTLSLTVDAEKLIAGAGVLKVSLSQQDGSLCLSVSRFGGDGTLVTDNVSVSVRADAEAPSAATIDEAYDVTAEHITFDSIDTLLQSFINTAKRKSFRLTGKVPVNLNALSIVKANIELGLDIRIDVEKDENGKDVVYIAAKLSRGELSGVTKLAFADNGGDSYLYYNGKDKTVTIKRNSLIEKKWCSKCNGFECSSTFWHAGFRTGKIISDMDYSGKCGYEQTVTEKEFADNVLDYILEMINFSDTINDAIVDATKSDDKKAFGIDDVLTDYSYSSPTYSVKLNLKPIDDVLGQANVYIDHNENSDLLSLYGDIRLLDISGVTADGTFKIFLVDSVDGEAKSLSTATQLF